MRAMDDLVSQGKARYIGCSNFSGWQLAEAQLIARSAQANTFVSAQNRYSLMSRDIEKELIPACLKYGAGVLPYFPLESGLLTGKYQYGKPPKKGTRWHAWKDRGAMTESFWSNDKLEAVGELQSLCHTYEHTLLDLAIGWLLDNAAVSSVIAGATKVSQIKNNIKASDFRPSDEEKLCIDAIMPPPPSNPWG